MSWEMEPDPSPLNTYKAVPASPKRKSGSLPELILACKLWDKITTKARNGEYEMPDELNHYGKNLPYSSGDYSPLQCRIDGDKAELTVGSATGHRVHVDVGKKILEYYDNDQAPNEVVRDLLEEAGLDCKIDHGEGVKCTKLSKENVQAVFKVLAMPTSMDFRIDRCRRDKATDPTEGCQESCDETLENDYKLPDGCSCNDWLDECVQECVDNSEPDDEPIEECKEIEKQFFHDGPQKETLTKAEAQIIPKSQKKITAFAESERKPRQYAKYYSKNIS